MGRVDFAGILKDICLAYVPEVGVGDYTIVHVGFAITQLDEASAQETLRLFSELGVIEEELNPEMGHEISGGISRSADRPAAAG
jgi:hydrogenase expression/formation protein HypC